MYQMNAVEYNEKVMKGHFKKIYPVIASQIVERTGITSGVCIDLGGGPGMLGISLAKITDLKVTVYDLMPECVDLVPQNSLENGVSDRVDAIQGMAEDMKFEDNSVDLVVSRGSVFFWEDQKKGLSEVYRVLKPGGWGYIGGGFGTKELMEEIHKQKEKEDPEWVEKKKERMRKNPPGHFQRIIEELGFGGTVDAREAGTWIIFQKQ
jgi:ubiquinone/menaquinone biosynthesis C-methylase UbiE